ncbi:MAG: NADH-quinone oxidoreductase subunit NuoB [Deltaproteobacteria bacterium]|nr:NADH-quinone oxidoreductase subunit NuoB [Deltaproteobacteria bacterium]
MWNILRTRLLQGQRTTAFPASAPELPPRFRGRLALDPSLCDEGCCGCVDVCPTNAIAKKNGLALDLGRCLFCSECVDRCPTDALTSTPDYRLATTSREALTLSGEPLELAQSLSADIAKRFGRSLGIRVVSAGGCAGCEAEVNALSNIVFDISRFGVHVVASPRHADALIVTGPVSQHMLGALEATYRAIPAPKFVIAVGACAISGGPYAESPQVEAGAASTLPIDLFIPGCPPHPYTMIDGILRALGRPVP